MRLLDKFKYAFIDFIIKSPKKTLLFYFLATTLLSLGIPFLKADFSYKVWYNDNDPMVVLYREFEKNFGNDDNVIVGIYDEKGIFTPRTVKLIQGLSDELYHVSDIIRVDSVLNFYDIQANGDEIDIEPILDEEAIENTSNAELREARSTALANDILIGSFINPDATFAIISAQVRPAHDTPPDYTKITAQVEDLLKRQRELNPDVEFVVTGPVIMTDAFRAITIKDMAFLIPLLYGIFTLILLYLFRSVSGVVLPYVTITFSTLMMLGTMGILGLTLNTLSSATPTILLTVALADAIHVITVYHLAKRKRLSPEAALRTSLEKNFYPTLLTTVTTALGFLSFFDAKIRPVSEMGVAVGFGAAYAWIATYALLGPMLRLFPGKISEMPPVSEDADARDTVPNSRSFHFASLVSKHAKAILVVSAIFGFLGIYSSRNLIVNMDPVEQFPKDHPMTQAYNIIEEQLGYIGTVEILIQAPEAESAKDPKFLGKVEEFEKWLRSKDHIKSTLSINDYLKKINRAFNNGNQEFYRLPPTSEHVAQELFFYSMGLPPEKPIENRINASRDAVRITVNWTIRSSKESNEEFERIQIKAKELGLNAKVTGKTPLFHDLTPYVVTTFVTSLSIALVTITIALSVILQSFRLGLFAMIPSVLPLMIGGGLFAFSGYHIDMGTVLVASVCLGIAVDDSVHFMFAYRRLIQEKTFKQTLATIIENVYPSLFNTTLLLVLGFSSFVFGTYIPNAKFGVSVAGILIIALVCDFIVLPALLAVFDKKKPLDKAA